MHPTMMESWFNGKDSSHTDYIRNINHRGYYKTEGKIKHKIFSGSVPEIGQLCTKTCTKKHGHLETKLSENIHSFTMCSGF